MFARGGFLKIISVGILAYAGMKTSFNADVRPIEAGFHAGIGLKSTESAQLWA